MQEITLKRSQRRPLRITGEEAWEYETSGESARSDYSGEVGRWWKLTCYRLADGRLVMHECRYTQWQGESDFFDAHVFATAEEAADWVEANYPKAAADFADEFGIVEHA